LAELSELDARIVHELQINARATNRAIAETVHVAASTSLERIRSLRERGVIRGYHAEIDLGALGRDVQALISIRIRPPSRENIEAFRDWAHRLPETVGVFVVSGGDDFLLHLAVPDTDALYDFVIDKLTERPEVADVNTSVVYEHLRTFALEPLRRGGDSRTPDGPARGS
jgi:DNA-binding Lrp family transcriptional regulator